MYNKVLNQANLHLVFLVNSREGAGRRFRGQSTCHTGMRHGVQVPSNQIKSRTEPPAPQPWEVQTRDPWVLRGSIFYKMIVTLNRAESDLAL